MLMPDLGPETDVYEYILEKIESVPHLETVILLWNSRPVGWTEEELASRLYVPADKAAYILRDLIRQQFVQETASSPPRFSYLPRSEEQNEWMFRVDTAYRREIVRISTMLHSKASPSVREFARAFRFKKDRD